MSGARPRRGATCAARTDSWVSVVAKEKLLNCSGKLCSGTVTTPETRGGGEASDRACGTGQAKPTILGGRLPLQRLRHGEGVEKGGAGGGVEDGVEDEAVHGPHEVDGDLVDERCGVHCHLPQVVRVQGEGDDAGSLLRVGLRHLVRGHAVHVEVVPQGGLRLSPALREGREGRDRGRRGGKAASGNMRRISARGRGLTRYAAARRAAKLRGSSE